MTSPARAGRLTAIQLRVDGELTARLLCGGPFSIVGGDEGEIALLPPGRVVAYLVAHGRTTGLYVFRTAGGGGRTVIPGVSEPVCLLLSSGRRGTAKRIRNFIRKVTSYGHRSLRAHRRVLDARGRGPARPPPTERPAAVIAPGALASELGRLVCAASVALVVTAGAAFLASQLTRNYTPSLPLGVYWIRPGLPITKGALVDFPIPPNARKLIADRYLPARFHLLKRVVAVEGDIVCLTDGSFFVDGISISTIARRDSIGRPLSAYEFCGPVTPGTAFVATPVPSSLDSRYFGPVPLSTLTVATPLWTS